MARVSAERRAIAAEYARGCNDPLLADLLADLADAETRAERHMRERCAVAAADAFALRDEPGGDRGCHPRGAIERDTDRHAAGEGRGVMDQDAVKAKAQMTDLVVAGWRWVGPDKALLHLRHEDGSEVDPVGLGLSLGARVRHLPGLAHKHVVESENGDLRIAMQTMHPLDGREVPAEANARLIAAHSPDVVRALAEVVGAARAHAVCRDDLLAGRTDEDHYRRMDAASDAVVAALARLDAATGGGG